LTPNKKTLSREILKIMENGVKKTFFGVIANS